MDLCADSFRWHERFVPIALDSDRILLLSEDDALLLKTPALAEIGRAFERRESLAAVCARLGDLRELTRLLAALDSLVVNGLAVPRDCPASSRPAAADADADATVPGIARYCRPDPQAIARRVDVNERVDVVLASCAVDEQRAIEWAMRLAAVVPGALTVAFCDDLLDDLLLRIDRVRRAGGRAWIPVKATGETVSVGPLFDDPARACWRCLADRLLRNRPVRHAWQERGQAWPGTPVRCESSRVDHALDSLLQAASAACEPTGAVGPDVRTLLTLDPDAPVTSQRRHAVYARPQCTECGDPGLMAARQARPLAWSRDHVAPTPPSDDVAAHLTGLISPVCGVVTSLEPVEPPSRRAGQTTPQHAAAAIYRSRFFKTPRPADIAFDAAATQTCLGKGFDTARARAGALCEALERHAAYHLGDEARVVASVSALDGPAWLPRQLAPHAAAACNADEAIGWAPAWSLTRDARCYLPFGFCYAHAPQADAARIGWHSNGCAAGETLERAIVHGFLEIVERDAVAAWWYNRAPRPCVNLHSTSADDLAVATATIGRALGPDWRWWALDLTHDLGIPVVAAVARHDGRDEWALGFGCAPTRARAVSGALAELLQLVAVDKCLKLSPTTPGGTEWHFLHPEARAPRAPARELTSDDELTHLRNAAAACDLEMLVLDYSRPDLPLRTVKVVVPGMSHFWPAWTTERMREVPVTLRWIDGRTADHDLNPTPLFV